MFTPLQAVSLIPVLSPSLTFPGNACQNGLVPALVRAPLPSVPPSLGMKHFLPFPLESLVPRFNSGPSVFSCHKCC
ncbi:hypothetical protein DNTS_027508 [Danionella cerebrum]|uniref:Uncharacterized protein n=1 Tax=Danionella cerebrum TaxID=2873325 RepID=A0A553RL85_9TELE|nr:hypothetical protein DNTS_027508 [Danionella translucida]